MPVTTQDYEDILKEVKEMTVHYDNAPYMNVSSNSFDFIIHAKNLKDKELLLKVEGVRGTASSTTTDLHVTVSFHADHCSILHNSQMFCTVKTKLLKKFLTNLIYHISQGMLELVCMAN